MQRVLIVLAFLASSVPAAAQMPASVHLREPECDQLPFDHARLRELFELELSVDGTRLVDDPAQAEMRIVYEPERCEPGETRFSIELERNDGALRVQHAEMSAVGLATIPRALALELAEALRGGARREEATAAAEPAPTEARPAPSQPVTPPAEAPPAEETPAGLPTRFILTIGSRNTPDTSGWLYGARLAIDLSLGHDLPLSLRVDLAAAIGFTAFDLPLAGVDGGVTIALWARAVPELLLRFGPRLWLGHGFILDAEGNGATRVSGEVQFGLGVVVGLEIRIAPGLDLIVGAEVGTHFEGVEYTLASGRAGFLGAYWGIDLGLAFAL